MEYQNFQLGQEFNKSFVDILNCEIVPPPYQEGTVPNNFFLKKRQGFSLANQNEVGTYWSSGVGPIDTDEVLDYERVQLKDGKVISYLLVRATVFYVSPDRYVPNEVALLTIYYNPAYSTSAPESTSYLVGLGAYDERINYKFGYVPHVKGLPLSDITAGINGSTTAVVGQKTVSIIGGASWTANIGDYLYLYDKVSGATEHSMLGQVLKIDYLDSPLNAVVSTNDWIQEPLNCKAKRFSSFGPVLAFNGTEKFYTLSNYESYTGGFNAMEAVNLDRVIDWTYSHGALTLLSRPIDDESSANVLRTYMNENCLVTKPMPVGSVRNPYNVAEFQDYSLVFSENSIDTVVTMTTKTPAGDREDETLVNVTKDFTIFGQNAFAIYNGGLYLMSNDKRFVAVSITPINGIRFTVDLQNQGIYIQKFLDKFESTDIVSVHIEDGNILLFKETPTGTEFFKYDFFYKGWFRWITHLRLRSKKPDVFFGENLYVQSLANANDSGTDFTQRIKIVLGEDNMFALKKQSFTKLALGTDSTDGTLARFTVHAGGRKTVYEVPLADAGFFERIRLAASTGLVGTTLLGVGKYMVGGDEASTLTDVAMVKANTGFTYEVAIIEFEALGADRFHFGGAMTGHDVMTPQVTPLENVV